MTRAAALLALVVASPVASQQANRFDILITGGRVIDGTGNPWFAADIGIRDGRIAAVGQLGDAPTARRIDARGRIVTPGFIDIHSHAADAPPRQITQSDPRARSARNLVIQGLTTLVTNQDGRGVWPLAEQRATMERQGIGPNVGLLVGHGVVRSRVMGDDHRRAATDDEIRQMRALVRQGMEEGALGMSGGYEYPPMRWATTEEIIALVREVKPWDGVFVAHERSSGTEPMWWWPSQDPPGQPTMGDAVRETIRVADETGVTSVLTHIKARGVNYWGSSANLVQLVERARARGVDVWADQYTYNTTGSDGYTILIPPRVLDRARKAAPAGARPNFSAALRRALADPAERARVERDVEFETMRRGGAENLVVIDHPRRDLVGKSLDSLARERKTSLVETALWLQLAGDSTRPGGGQLRGFSLSERDVERFMRQPWVATSTDAGIAFPGDGPIHPRYYGTYPRKLREYVLTRGVVTMEFAIRSMTSLPAQILGVRDRGLLREGFWADVVIFDLATIEDRATALDPFAEPAGIDIVLVNGQVLVEKGDVTDALPGQVLISRRLGEP